MSKAEPVSRSNGRWLPSSTISNETRMAHSRSAVHDRESNHTTRVGRPDPGLLHRLFAATGRDTRTPDPGVWQGTIRCYSSSGLLLSLARSGVGLRQLANQVE